ncbi:MAG: hypothetical protein QJT81_03740 [Candidatus Thiothrix putei]|uniref:Uncharacterized protein n=1 Tax=Candidatus Thiothrix putei TaxID=3080811 RepID=A0AA95HFR4_9GAMM|nr:MAG: hypothetical protein QJT81_03740 [Candidatus Thiothrix putei]
MGSSGVGKTLLIQHWLQYGAPNNDNVPIYHWRFSHEVEKFPFHGVFAVFIDHMLEWLEEPDFSHHDCLTKVNLLIKRLQHTKVLLILDNIPESMLDNASTINDGDSYICFDMFLKQLASVNAGLCLLITRSFANMQEWKHSAVYHLTLNNFSFKNGAALLHKSHLQNYIFSVNLPSSEGKKKCGLPFSAIIEASKQPLSPRYEFYRTRPDCTTLEFAAN